MQLKVGLKPYNRVKNYIVWYETNQPYDLILTQITKDEYEKNPIYKDLQIKVIE